MLGREQLRGHLDLYLILSVLGRESAHGYEVLKKLKERGDGSLELREGSLYPALYRLEDRGLIESQRESAGGRVRRVYRLTRTGKSELKKQTKQWNAFTSFVGAVLEGN